MKQGRLTVHAGSGEMPRTLGLAIRAAEFVVWASRYENEN